MKNLLVVANPASGAGRAAAIAPTLVQALATKGIRAKIYLTTADPRDDALDDAILKSDTVIAVGGDGTLNRVARPILLAPNQEGRLPAVAFFPIGTGNVAARAFRLPRRLSDIVNLVEAGTVLKIDAGVVFKEGVPSAVFLLWLGAGLDGALIHAVAKSRSCHGYRGLRLILQYVLETPRTFFTYPFPKVRLWSKQVDAEYAGVMLANIGQIAVGSVTKKADPQDGLVDVIAMLPRNRLSWCLTGLLAGCNASPLCPGIQRYREKQVQLSATEPVPVQIDGEPWGPLPVTVEMRQAALSLLAPGETPLAKTSGTPAGARGL